MFGIQNATVVLEYTARAMPTKGLNDHNMPPRRGCPELCKRPETHWPKMHCLATHCLEMHSAEMHSAETHCPEMHCPTMHFPETHCPETVLVHERISGTEPVATV